ncbi:hypothetical protein C0J52_00182 [Blattella germanica]|nr:hypothetical protein C0J52_00182 [Blattella germanica]
MLKYNKQMMCKQKKVRKHAWVTRRDMNTMTAISEIVLIQTEEDHGSHDNLMPHPGPQIIDYREASIQCNLDEASGDRYRIPVKEGSSSTYDVLFGSRTFNHETPLRRSRRSSSILKHERMEDKAIQSDFSAFSQTSFTTTPRTTFTTTPRTTFTTMPEVKEMDDSTTLQILEISNQICVRSTEKDPNVVVKIADMKITGFQVTNWKWFFMTTEIISVIFPEHQIQFLIVHVIVTQQSTRIKPAL